ncbi:DUF2937 family protein [Alteromonas sp. ALT199]|uniref:DUF2937 family protein n=1 Tax=unclassified Alteromonas TaxID=2614992 RepID=UPI001BE5EAB1|nr:DUF2937 family protein [Alteromonas sp. ALT199]MBT3136592.1 DUF2937 family protein [Alteromonas sp. ALT199]
MVVRVLDKVVFAVLFIITLQVPILADHYRQYLNGYYDALRDEVSSSSELAKQHGFSSVEAMLDSLQQNSEPVVRENASMKASRFAQITTLEQGMRKLEHGHYFEKLVFMASPTQYGTLNRVLDNFSPSVPLTPSSIVFSLVTAILLNLLIWTPHFCYCQVKKVKDKPKRYSYK